MSASPSGQPQQSKRAARAETAARKRGARDEVQQARRQELLRQWQRASLLLAVALMTMLVSLPYGVLWIANHRWASVSIPTRYEYLWLAVLGVGWLATLVLGLLTVATATAMRRTIRVFWLVVLALPPFTVPLAAAFALLRRGQLQDDVFADGPPPRQGRWGF